MTKTKLTAGAAKKPAPKADKGKPSRPKALPVQVRAAPFKLYSMSTLSTELKISRETIVRRFGEAGIKAAGKARGHDAYRLLDAVNALFGGSDSGNGETRVQTSVERQQYYGSELKRIELETKQRLLVPAVEVEATVANIFRILTQFLNGLTDRVERDAGLTPEQAAAVTTSIDSCRRELYGLLRRAFADPDAIAGMPRE